MDGMAFDLAPSLQMPFVGVLVLFWTGLLWLAWSRENRARLGWRMIWSTTAVLALAAVALRPYWYQREAVVNAVFLTEGYDLAQLKKLQYQQGKRETAYFTNQEKATNATFIADVEDLYEKYPHIDTLFLLGNGLPPEQLKALEGRKYKFFLSDAPQGVIQFTYPKTVREESPIPVSGVYHHTDTSEVLLELKSPYGYTTLLKTRAPGRHEFRAEITAKQPGKYLFSLVRNHAPDEQQFPVIITPKKRFSALIINHVPSFENKYLKNWLADQGYEVSVRTAISKYKYKTEFLNRPAVNLDQLKSSMLNRFDVLILSGNTLINLQESERNAIQVAVRKGLGLCILAQDELLESTFHPGFFLPFSFAPAPAEVSLPAGWQQLQEAFELPASGYQVREQFGRFPLLLDLKNGNRVAFTRQGLGRIAVNLIQQSYLLQLRGKDRAYAAIWSELLDNIIRQDFVRNQWWVNDELISAPHHQMDIDLLSDETLPKGIAQSPEGHLTAFYFQQALQDNEKWSSRFWPRGEGWHQLRTGENRADAEWVYVQSLNHWKALRAFTRQQSNREWLALNASSPVELKKPERPPTLKLAVPLWWFYLLFLGSMGLLWLEEKF